MNWLRLFNHMETFCTLMHARVGMAAALQMLARTRIQGQREDSLFFKDQQGRKGMVLPN